MANDTQSAVGEAILLGLQPHRCTLAQRVFEALTAAAACTVSLLPGMLRAIWREARRPRWTC